MTINIRPETSIDAATIRAVIEDAFSEVAYSDKTEQHIVEALRAADVLPISLVAEDQHEILGHVAVSPVSISDGANDWYGLGPIAVHPSNQRCGIGTLLMNAAIDQLKTINASGCVLLGDPNYYHRFGFKVIQGLELPGVPAAYFQALVLKDKTPQGRVRYHAAFDAR